MPELTPALWLVLPLGIAAGVDLYLTLLLLGLAPTLPWWDHPLPGGLSDLSALPILAVLAAMYVAELKAERRPVSYLAWNATHALIRPMSGALLAALLLHGSPTGTLLGGAAAGGLLAFLAHAIRSGGAILRTLEPRPGPAPTLVGALEDALVLGLVTASLDAPGVALVGAGLMAAATLPGGASRVRAFVFATRLAAARVFQAFRKRQWTPTDGLPRWVRLALSGDALATGGGLRGAHVGVVGMRGSPRFARGWLVVTGGRPVFVPRAPRRDEPFVELGTLAPRSVVEEAFHRTLDLESEEGVPVRILFFIDGPGPGALAADFGMGTQAAPADRGQENL